MKIDSKYLAKSGIIAAIYVVLCFALAPISYGVIQVRVAEALTLLPIIFPEAVLGLGVGVVLTNLIGPFGIIDIVFGSLATILAAIFTYKTRKTKIAFVWPIIFNALIVGAYLPAVAGIDWAIPFSMLSVGVGEAIAVIVLGLPLLKLIKSRIEKQKG